MGADAAQLRRQAVEASGLFDPEYYLNRYPDVAGSGMDPWYHYSVHGISEGRDPNAFLSADWYAATHPERGCTRADSFHDYLETGWRLGLDPHPDFSIRRYLEAYPEVGAGGEEPLADYLRHRAAGDRVAFPHEPVAAPEPAPTPAEARLAQLDAEGLFDPEYYLFLNPDVAAAGIDPRKHYLSSGEAEGRNPNPFFSVDWYIASYPDRGCTRANAREDYIATGCRLGYDPHPEFSVTRYLAAYPAVSQSGDEPLADYLRHRASGARQRFPGHKALPMSVVYAQADQISGSALSKLREDALGDIETTFAFRAMNIVVDDVLTMVPSLLILLPGLNRRYATGGPNTAYILGCLLAQQGIPVRFLSLDAPPDPDLGPLKLHLKQLTDIDVDAYDVRFLDAHDRTRPLRVGRNDVLFATAWWTAQPAKAAAGLLRTKRFYYLIQDYESMFHGLSVVHAMAAQTYGYDHLPVINTSLLRDHLSGETVGLYADPDFVGKALVFEPAVDRSHFYAEPRRPGAPRRLLFYTRPTMAPRNLFGLGVAALQTAVSAGLFGDSGWEFIGMGEHFNPVPLGRGYTLTPAPWLDFSSYAALMRGADILLSLMLSPHPSYPPLEIAACGGIVVTTEYGSKTAARLAEISPDIIGVPATLEDLVEALTRARLLRDQRMQPEAHLTPLPRTWVESLSAVIPRLVDALAADGVRRESPALPHRAPARGIVQLQTAAKALQNRKALYRCASTPDLLDVITVLPADGGRGLEELAHDILGQDTELPFRWIIMVPNADRADRDRTLAALRTSPHVHVVVADPGLTGDCRHAHALRATTARYVTFADVRCRMTSDAVRLLQACIEQTGYPPMIYSVLAAADDDPPSSEAVPGWDPVLLIHSHRLSPLMALERQRACDLRLLDGMEADAEPTWHAALQLAAIGQCGVCLTEVLGAANSGWGVAPPREPRRARVRSYLAYLSNNAECSALEASFKGKSGRSPLRIRAKVAATRSVEVVRIGEQVSRSDFAAALAGVTGGLVWLCASWAGPPAKADQAHALGLIGVFPDTVMVGGIVHRDGAVLESIFLPGFGGFGSHPDAGFGLAELLAGDAGKIPRSVAGVSARFALVDVEFLRQVLPELPERFGLSLLGPWLGMRARDEGRRIIFTPDLRLGAGTDVQAGLPQADAVRLALRFGDRTDDVRGRGERAAAQALHERGLGSASLPWFSHPALLEARAAARAARLAPRPAALDVALLTTVYLGTDAALFRATADAVRRQIRPPREWLVLAHGPVSPELSAVLAGFAAEKLIRLLQRPKNLGIHGGLRLCLEQARASFTLSLDADDILTPDALDILYEAALADPDCEIFYTDEDLLIEGRPMHAFYRPDYDPVHLRAHSFIWHSIMFRRARGTALGVYTNGAAQYAQDWDTLLRFEFAGQPAQHVPEVICHWRQHASSLSNSGCTFQGSLDSVQGVLDMVRATSEHPDLLEVAPYPADTGSPDFYLKRAETAPPAMLMLRLGAASPPPAFDFAAYRAMPARRGSNGLSDLAEILADASSDLVLLLGPGVQLWDDRSLWQALRHFELCKAVDYVGGSISRRTSEIIAGPAIRTSADRLLDFTAGCSMLDRGTDMLTRLKPVSVSALSLDILLARRTALARALADAPEGLALRSLGLWIGLHAERAGRVLAYEPLLRGLVHDASGLVGDPAATLSHSLASWIALGSFRQGPARGPAGFHAHRRLHQR